MIEIPNNSQTQQPTIPKDSGSFRAGLIAWIVGALAFIAIVCIRQGVFDQPAPPPVAGIVAPGPNDPAVMTAKILVKLKSTVTTTGSPEAAALVKHADSGSKDPIDQFRLAILESELAGPAPAIERLRAIDPNLSHDGKPYLSPEDAATLASHRDLALRVLDHDASTLTDKERASLTDAHGSYADLLLTHGLPDSDPARAPLVSGGGRILFLILAVGVVVVAYGITGLVMMVLFFTRLSKKPLVRTFAPPTPGGSVYLETVAVFITGFLALQLGARFLPQSIAPSENVQLLLQWTLLATAFWPLLRGVPFATFRRQIGLHTPQGIAREIRTGISSYFAALPFLAAAVILLAVYLILRQAFNPDAQPLNNPVAERIGHSGSASLLIFFTLATIWAPLVEEMIFRGALYRHLRGRVGVLAAATGSALVFGFLHGYALPLLIPVLTLGFIFALLREWRGSLVASMTAHFIHNFTILSFAVAFLKAIG